VSFLPLFAEVGELLKATCSIWQRHSFFLEKQSILNLFWFAGDLLVNI